ncbi:glycosyltransferase family 2 protein [Leeuwenhoekiella sp. NPDC079379]|uniref:glycosyltransferase family 2 protein n=1 Tax=Leeuwenhoekiella sp. NPDC079379 TaxID=3364122 RepID=UPI0037CC13BC
MKLITIILPVYNGEKYLKQSIESCLNQSHSYFELIIIDDFSADNSREIIREFKGSDSRIRFYKNKKNIGLPETLNKGHELAKGNYITWTSDDNTYHKNALEILLKNIAIENSEFVYSHCNVIDESGSEIGFLSAKNPENLFFENCVGACFLYTRKFIETVGTYNADRTYVEDYDYWLRGLQHFKLKPVKEILYSYRFHNSNLTADISRDIVKKKQFSKNLKDSLKGLVGMSDGLLDYFIKAHFKEQGFSWELVKNRDLILEGNLLEEKSGLRPNVLTSIMVIKLVNLIFQTREFQNLQTLGFIYTLKYFWKAKIPIKRRAALIKKCAWG